MSALEDLAINYRWRKYTGRELEYAKGFLANKKTQAKVINGQ